MTKKLSIVSFNVFGSPHSLNKFRRMPAISKAIADLEPDIVCLQEVFYRGDRRKIEKLLLKKGYFRMPVKYGILLSKTGGVIVYSKFEIEKTSFQRYENQGPLIPLFSISDRVAGKGFLHVRVKWNKEIVNIVNTHVLCNYRNIPKELEAIREQFKQLSTYINEKINSSERIIFCGDLNVSPANQIYKEFALETKLYDPLDGLNKSSIHVAYRKPIFRDTPERLDYTCFRNFDEKKIKQKIVFENAILSDHMGIYSTYSD